MTLTNFVTPEAAMQMYWDIVANFGNPMPVLAQITSEGTAKVSLLAIEIDGEADMASVLDACPAEAPLVQAMISTEVTAMMHDTMQPRPAILICSVSSEGPWRATMLFTRTGSEVTNDPHCYLQNERMIKETGEDPLIFAALRRMLERSRAEAN